MCVCIMYVCECEHGFECRILKCFCDDGFYYLFLGYNMNEEHLMGLSVSVCRVFLRVALGVVATAGANFSAVGTEAVFGMCC